MITLLQVDTPHSSLVATPHNQVVTPHNRVDTPHSNLVGIQDRVQATPSSRDLAGMPVVTHLDRVPEETLE